MFFRLLLKYKTNFLFSNLIVSYFFCYFFYSSAIFVSLVEKDHWVTYIFKYLGSIVIWYLNSYLFGNHINHIIFPSIWVMYYILSNCFASQSNRSRSILYKPTLVNILKENSTVYIQVVQSLFPGLSSSRTHIVYCVQECTGFEKGGGVTHFDEAKKS